MGTMGTQSIEINGPSTDELLAEDWTSFVAQARQVQSGYEALRDAAQLILRGRSLLHEVRGLATQQLADVIAREMQELAKTRPELAADLQHRITMQWASRFDAEVNDGAMPAEGFLLGPVHQGISSFSSSKHHHTDLVDGRLPCAECFAEVGGSYGYRAVAMDEARALQDRARQLVEKGGSLATAVDRAFAELQPSAVTLEKLSREGLEHRVAGI